VSNPADVRPGTGEEPQSAFARVPAGLQTIGGALAWLSGAIAAIGAILYAFGYVASIGYVRMLGLELTELRYDYTFYLQRGGSFFLLLIVEIVPFVFCVLLLVLGVVALWHGLRSWFLNAPVVRRLSQRNVNWRMIVYFGLFLLLALQLSTHLSYPEWMAVSGVLARPDDVSPAASGIRNLIVASNERVLRSQFTYLAVQYVWIGTLLFLAWRVCCTQRRGLLMTAPFALVFVISTIYLALDYGTLMLPAKFQETEVQRNNTTTTMYLVNRMEDRYGLWNPCDRKMEWLPSDQIGKRGDKQTIEHILASARKLCAENRSG
jgi:hypothetical protein